MFKNTNKSLNITYFITKKKFRYKLYPHLIGIHEYDLLDVQREEHVEEQNLVPPDGALAVALPLQPARPLVLHQLVLEAVLLSHVREDVLRTNTRNISKTKPKRTLRKCFI